MSTSSNLLPKNRNKTPKIEPENTENTAIRLKKEPVVSVKQEPVEEEELVPEGAESNSGTPVNGENGKMMAVLNNGEAPPTMAQLMAKIEGLNGRLSAMEYAFNATATVRRAAQEFEQMTMRYDIQVTNQLEIREIKKTIQGILEELKKRDGSSAPKFQLNEKLTCVKNGHPYEAKVVRILKDKGVPHYVIHYKGWNARCDEWIPIGKEDGKMFKGSVEEYQKAKKNGARKPLVYSNRRVNQPNSSNSGPIVDESTAEKGYMLRHRPY